MVIETILNPNYFDQAWLNEFINSFKVQNVTTQIIVISVIAGIGITHLLKLSHFHSFLLCFFYYFLGFICNVALLLGNFFHLPPLCLPGLLFQVAFVLATQGMTFKIFFSNWDSSAFYSGLVPQLFVLLLLYFWIVEYAYFKEMQSGKTQIRPQQHQPPPPAPEPSPPPPPSEPVTAQTTVSDLTKKMSLDNHFDPFSSF